MEITITMKIDPAELKQAIIDNDLIDLRKIEQIAHKVISDPFSSKPKDKKANKPVTDKQYVGKSHDKSCIQCGKVFHDKSKYNNRRLCSASCKAAYKRTYQRDYKANKPAIDKQYVSKSRDKSCIQCGKVFHDKLKCNRRKFCSASCREAYKRTYQRDYRVKHKEKSLTPEALPEPIEKTMEEVDNIQKQRESAPYVFGK